MAARTGNSALVGRPPMPTALKIVRGVRPSRIDLGAVEPTLAMPPKPADLAPAVAIVWDEVQRDLALTRVTVGDGRAVRVYAEAAVVVDQLTAMYHATGSLPMIRARGGDIAPNPILAALTKATTAFQVAAREIGATPASRSAVRVPPKAADKFSQFLDAKPKAARPRRRAS